MTVFEMICKGCEELPNSPYSKEIKARVAEVVEANPEAHRAANEEFELIKEKVRLNGIDEHQHLRELWGYATDFISFAAAAYRESN